MSDFFNPPTTQCARRPYRCIYCGETIENGHVYQKQKGVWDGEWFTNHYHPECFHDFGQTGDPEFHPHSNERPQLAVAAKP